MWPFARPFKGKKSNCLLWAWDKFDNEGGYLVIRWCRINKYSKIKWPHFLWLDEKHHKLLEHYTPIRGLGSPINRECIPQLWFNGRVIKGDYKKEYIEGKKPWYIPAFIYNIIFKPQAIEN
ncbi:MAG: hypothetical protein ACREAU_00485 [Nitrosopumilaceae archaeon]